MSNFEISGGKIKDLFCHYTYREEISEGIFNTGSIKSELPIHDDLRNAFQALKPHFPFLLEYMKVNDELEIREAAETIPPTNFLNLPEDLDLYFIESLFYDHEDDSIIIKGKRVLAIGVIPFETPSIGLTGYYVFKKALRVHVNLLLSEIEAYHGGKRAPIMVQGDLFPEAEIVEMDQNLLDGATEETPEQLEERIQREIEEGKRNADGSIKKKGRGRKKKEKTEDELNAIED